MTPLTLEALSSFLVLALCSILSQAVDTEEFIAVISNNVDQETVFISQEGHHSRRKREVTKKTDTSKASVTFEEQVNFLRWHNGYRKNVSPNATDMQQMSWEDDLSSLAQAWTDNCVWKHGHPEGMEKPYNWVGQNMWAGTGGYHETGAVGSWYNEVRYYNFGKKKCKSGKVCGHYTQVVWKSSNRLGCGITFCETMEGLTMTNVYFIVCNYGPGGNIGGVSLYEKGDSCSNCPSDEANCVDRLCSTDPICDGLTCSGSDSLIKDVCECGDPTIGETLPDDFGGGGSSAGGLHAFAGSVTMAALCIVVAGL